MEIPPLGAIVGVNLVILVATRVSFDVWVSETLGYLDVDMVGTTGLLWIPLVILATTLVVIGFRVTAARWAAGVVFGALAVIVVDHVIGALRNGAVTTPGAVTGGLMVLQLAALALSVVVASRSDSHGVATVS